MLELATYNRLKPMVPELSLWQSRNVKTLGHTMHCHYRQGNGSQVIMLHGNPTWSIFYRRMAGILGNEYELIAPDQLGCGLSDKMLDPKMYSVQSRVDAFSEFMTAVDKDKKIHLMVHDWGGMIGCAWAVNNISRIKSITIMNTAAFPSPLKPALPFPLPLFRNPVLGRGIIQSPINGFLLGTLLTCSVKKIPSIIKDLYRLPHYDWNSRRSLFEFVRTIPAAPKDAYFEKLTKLETNLNLLREIPILLYWGKKDFIFSAAFLHKWMTLFPHAETQIIENSSHLVMEDASDEQLAGIRNFIARHD